MSLARPVLSRLENQYLSRAMPGRSLIEADLVSRVMPAERAAGAGSPSEGDIDKHDFDPIRWACFDKRLKLVIPCNERRTAPSLGAVIVELACREELGCGL